MRLFRGFRWIAGAVISVGIATAACGSADEATFPDPDSDPSFGDGSTGDFPSPDGGGSTDPHGLGSDQEACASSFLEGNVKPVNLVFMYDKSKSMLESTGGALSKWEAAKKGVTSFIADPSSTGLTASIQFFSGPALKGQTGPLCEAATYSTAAAGPVPLPDTASVISGAIAKQSPAGGTASYWALQGARQIASGVLATKPGERAAIVFVTDGVPDGCASDNSIANTAVVAAQSFAAGVPVYVVGVGKSLTNLNTIATSGGTSAAFIVDANGGDVSSSLIDALKAIRGQVASCSLEIPPAPAGKTLDYNAVNVGYGGQTLSYSSDCSSGAGWHYDDASAPHTIELCPSTCEDVKKTAGAKVTLALGCATKGGVR